MKVFLRTWRYGLAEALAQGYHGQNVKVDSQNMMLHVVRPVLATGSEEEGTPDTIGELTTVTITAGDEFTVVQCENCGHHPDEPTAEKAVVFIDESLTSFRGRL